jgi:hypothetical protein
MTNGKGRGRTPTRTNLLRAQSLAPMRCFIDIDHRVTVKTDPEGRRQSVVIARGHRAA